MSDIMVKICGITNVEDGLYSVEKGADILGVVRSEKSPRKGTPELIDKLSSLGAQVAGVYTEMESVRNITSNEDYVQLHFPHGNDEITFVKEKLERKVISVVFAYGGKSPLEAALEKIGQGADLVLLEYGKKGWISHSKKIPAIGKRPIGIAGRVSLEDLRELMGYSPHFIDVSSSLEQYPGKKDHAKVREFMEVLRTEEATV